MMRPSICTVTLAMAGSLGTAAWAEQAADKLEKRMAQNPALVSRMELLLPPGTSLQAAADGFKDEAQFMAALHVSRNLNIPFNELKADLRRSKYASLNQALRDLRPELRTWGIEHQVKKAQRQAQSDLSLAGEVATNSTH